MHYSTSCDCMILRNTVNSRRFRASVLFCQTDSISNTPVDNNNLHDGFGRCGVCFTGYVF